MIDMGGGTICERERRRVRDTQERERCVRVRVSVCVCVRVCVGEKGVTFVLVNVICRLFVTNIYKFHMTSDPTVLGWKKVYKKQCSSEFSFPVYKWITTSKIRPSKKYILIRPSTKYISFTPKTDTG